MIAGIYEVSFLLTPNKIQYRVMSVNDIRFDGRVMTDHPTKEDAIAHIRGYFRRNDVPDGEIRFYRMDRKGNHDYESIPVDETLANAE